VEAPVHARARIDVLLERPARERPPLDLGRQPAAAFSSFDPQAPLIRPKSSAASLDRRGPLADYRDICWAIGSELLSSVNVSSKRPHRASLASLGALFRRKFGRK
jgi:hypothetical protein